MSQAIIVLNAGSSSLKFSLYAVDDPKLSIVAQGQVEGLGTSPQFKAKDGQSKVLADDALKNSGKTFGHHEAFSHIAAWMRQHYAAQYSPIGIGHRIVHGGSKFAAPELIDDAVMKELEELIPLAPLHQPHNLEAIRAVKKLNPNVPQVGCFDTAFHHGRSTVSRRFGLPDELFRQGIQRWGFHGLSYESISGKLRGIAPALSSGRVIVAHLGSGASLCAMRGGRSVETTMSFSVLDGLPMGTRCGGLDPGVVLYLLERGMTHGQIEELLYKKSGLLGISGVSNDVRDLLKSNNPLAAEAIEYFVYHIIRQIGSLIAVLGGIDGLIFTAGIGENSSVIRERVCKGLACFDISIDAEANRLNSERISPKANTPSVWVIPTDEEGVIASHTLAVIRVKR